jgi:hypothetical protein
MILCVRDKGDILLWNAMQQKIKPIARPAPDSYRDGGARPRKLEGGGF